MPAAADKKAPSNTFEDARGRKRAAALLIALGPELAADVLRQLSYEDIGRLTWEIGRDRLAVVVRARGNPRALLRDGAGA